MFKAKTRKKIQKQLLCYYRASVLFKALQNQGKSLQGPWECQGRGIL